VKLRDRAFQRAFSRTFVYNILWEDAEVDERFLGVDDSSSVLAITGAGCGVAGLVSQQPRRIDAVDINPHHLALTALKTTAAQRMESYGEFYDLFGRGWSVEPDRTVRRLAEYLPRWMQKYWKRHAGRFQKSLYTEGLTARFLSVLRRYSGVDADWLRGLMALPLEERDAYLDDTFSVMFSNPAVQAFMRSPLQLLALGVNFTQRDRLLEATGQDIVTYFMDHLRRLARTEVETNWFIWWVITHQFNHDHPDAAPPYLRRNRHERSFDAPTSVRYHHRNIFDVLEEAHADTWTHYMLCDAPDWMPPATQERLLEDVVRTAKDGAIFLYRSVEDECMVERLGWQDRLVPLTDRIAEASRLDRTKQYQRVNFYRVAH
jgi:S-adenosylmethionine-diacylglycerol 3-amino-3-carboxypropyl transferase